MPLTFLRTLALCAVIGALAACGGRQGPEGGEDLLTGVMPSMMTASEERARDFLLDMAFILEQNADDYDQGLERLQAMLTLNRAEMMEVARTIEANFAALEGAERRVWEAQFAALMQPAYVEWREHRDALIRADQDAGRRLAAIIEQNDTGQ